MSNLFDYEAYFTGAFHGLGNEDSRVCITKVTLNPYFKYYFKALRDYDCTSSAISLQTKLESYLKFKKEQAVSLNEEHSVDFFVLLTNSVAKSIPVLKRKLIGNGISNLKPCDFGAIEAEIFSFVQSAFAKTFSKSILTGTYSMHVLCGKLVDSFTTILLRANENNLHISSIKARKLTQRLVSFLLVDLKIACVTSGQYRKEVKLINAAERTSVTKKTRNKLITINIKHLVKTDLVSYRLSIPIVCSPKPWVIDKNSGMASSGGYLLQSRIYNKLISIKPTLDNRFSLTDNSLLSGINFVQRQRFFLDYNLSKLLTNDSNLYLHKDLPLGFSDRFESYVKMRGVSQGVLDGDPELHLKFLSKFLVLRSLNTSHYLVSLLAAVNPQILYSFPLTVDWRLRFYAVTRFGYTSRKFTRVLLRFTLRRNTNVDSVEYLRILNYYLAHCFLDVGTKLGITNEAFYSFDSSKLCVKDSERPLIFAYYKKCAENKIVPNFTLDATGSMLQGLAVLTGNQELALNCNVCQQTVFSDPYLWICPLSDKYPKLTRGIIKNAIIVVLYGAGQQTVKEKLAEAIGLPRRRTPIVLAMYKYIIGRINEVLKVELKLIFLLRFICARHEGSDIYNYPGVKRTMFYNQQHLKQLSVTNREWHYRPSVNTKMPEKDKEHSFLGAGANLLHGFDASVCHFVIKCFKEKGYPIYTIHDSFTVLPEHRSFLLESYQQGLINLKNTPLCDIYSGFNEKDPFIIGLECARANLLEDDIRSAYCLKP
jgi:hypothetical protein